MPHSTLVPDTFVGTDAASHAPLTVGLLKPKNRLLQKKKKTFTWRDPQKQKELRWALYISVPTN